MKAHIIGVDKFVKDISIIKNRLKYSKTANNVVAAMMYRDIIDHFENEQGPNSKWKKLKPATILRRKKGGGGAKILQDTGMLRGAINYFVEKRNAVVSVKKTYAGTHNFGYPSKNIPQRKFMYIAKNTLNKIIKYFSEFLFKIR